MREIEIFPEKFWKPLAYFGIHNKFFYINSHTIINTWIAIAIILAIMISIRLILQYKRDSLLGFLVLYAVSTFKDFMVQTFGFYKQEYFNFFFSLFVFILIANLLPLIPFLEEPTADISTTLALGITAFTYVQIQTIMVVGFKNYIKEFFSPIFVLFPLHVISELGKIISLSFRLFGNIFGGSVISKIWLGTIGGSILWEILAIFSGINIIILLFFVLFEGFIQAFVFSILSMTYLSLAISAQREEH